MLKPENSPFSETVDELAREVVDSAFKVHSQLGPGLLESIYRACLVYELRKRGRTVHSPVQVPIIYDGVKMRDPLWLDLLVDNTIVVELKAVEMMHPVFQAQLLTYMKLSGKRLGFLINFNVATIKQGIQRMAR